MRPHELKGEQALEYILAGNGKATIIGKEHRYTFKFAQPKEKDAKIIFVSLLTGPDNEVNYQYLGYINAQHTNLLAGVKGNPNHPAYKAMDWYIKALNHHSSKANDATFMHEGVCCKCGRTLTNPESIENGIGPECAKRIKR